MLEYENELYKQGITLIAGVDEVGRGPLVGPVVTAAVILPKWYFLEGINNSKKLTEKQRDKYYDIIMRDALAVSIGMKDNKVIDEVNHINSAILNDLKLLFNFDMDSRDHAVVLLTGLNQICNVLSLSSHEPLRQRIIMNYKLSELSTEEARSYIIKKLEGAECHQVVFEDAALEAIDNSAGGIPRVINKICNTSLLIGNAQGLNTISTETVMRAVEDCNLRCT